MAYEVRIVSDGRLLARDGVFGSREEALVEASALLYEMRLRCSGVLDLCALSGVRVEVVEVGEAEGCRSD